MMGAEKLTTLLEKRNRINALLRAERGKKKGETRKQENRRKILAGSFLLEQAKRDPSIREWMERGLARFVQRPDERALFDFLQNPAADKTEAAETQRPVELPASMGQVNGLGQAAN